MRNLKKILALVLALVMSMSLLATANASFADKDKIDPTYAEAVEVLNGLNVFKGRTDGNFDPKAGITRAEVAAIIYRIVTGDVEDKQVKLYSDYKKFTDVNSASWYAGYVNFCANGEYIKGYPDGKFGPNDAVTGYQALAMILRAVGYDKNGEFTGKEWQTQTAAVAKSLGITNNIIPGTLGTAATRETVAEILFRAILVPTVEYTLAYGYKPTETTLGWKAFKLEQVEGVVTANEYANLYDTEALADGKTQLGDRVLNVSTALTDIGEARYAYVSGKTVYAIADTGSNTVWENDGAAVKNIAKASGLNVKDAEYFVNFDGNDTFKASDMKIKYVVEAEGLTDEQIKELEDNGAKKDNGAYVKSIAPGREINNIDLKWIKSIFDSADKEGDNYIEGEVYVGTQSNKDISDEISFKKFKEEYVESAENALEFDTADNGEWLKVVDIDGDGKADFVMRLDFAMSLVTRVSKNGNVTLVDLAKKDEVAFGTTTIEKDELVTEAELAAGDVVVYTLIDGVYYVDAAEVATETIDKKGINSKTETITCNGTDYVQSHIGYADPSKTEYYHDVTDAHTEMTYDLYLDKFGYVRLYIESDYNAFMLLTDGYYETDRRDETFKAMYWDVEAGKETEIKVTGSTADDFISTTDRNNDGDRETWRRLINAGIFYNFNSDNKYITNIAGYTTNDEAYTLIDAEDTTKRTGYDVQELEIDSKTKLKDEVLENANGGRIQTTTKTQYYLVIKATDRFGGEYVSDVLTWTGYKNAPAEAALAENAVAYAVTHDAAEKNEKYDVADVVVFETDPTADHNTYFVYETNNYTKEYVWALGYGEDGKIVDDRFDVEEGTAHIAKNGPIEFYEIYEDTTVEHIFKDYADHNIYAGKVDVLYDVTGFDYFQVADTATGYLRFNPEEVPIYKVTGDSNEDKGEYDVKVVDNYDDIDYDDRMILFTDNKENVQYAICVDMSTYAPTKYNTEVYSDVLDLYNKITKDANTVAPTEAATMIEVLSKFDTQAEINADNLHTAEAALDLAKDLKPSAAKDDAEWDALQKAIADVTAAIAAYKADEPLNAAKKAARDMLAEKTASGQEWASWTPGMIAAVNKHIDAETNKDKLAKDELESVASQVQNAQNAAIGELKEYTYSEYTKEVATQLKAAYDAAETAINAIASKNSADYTEAVAAGNKAMSDIVLNAAEASVQGKVVAIAADVATNDTTLAKAQSVYKALPANVTVTKAVASNQFTDSVDVKLTLTDSVSSATKDVTVTWTLIG